MTLADRIRKYTYDAYLAHRTKDGDAVIRVRAGDVHSDLGLQSRMPAVCSALEGKKFQNEYGLELVNREGPHRGANVYFYFRKAGSNAILGSDIPKPVFKIQARTVDPSSKQKATVPFEDKPGDVFLVSCVKSKQDHATPAKEMYISNLFRSARGFVQSRKCNWFILSAKYGLLQPDQVIEPYELTLKGMPIAERRNWANRVIKTAEKGIVDPSRIVFLAGQQYREFLLPYYQSIGVETCAPMARLSLGNQPGWLQRNTLHAEN